MVSSSSAVRRGGPHRYNLEASLLEQASGGTLSFYYFSWFRFLIRFSPFLVFTPWQLSCPNILFPHRWEPWGWGFHPSIILVANWPMIVYICIFVIVFIFKLGQITTRYAYPQLSSPILPCFQCHGVFFFPHPTAEVAGCAILG